MITSAPDEVIYNTAFSVGTLQAADITEVSLVRLGAATHSFDMDTRFLRLQFTQSGNTLNVAAPANGNIAPPGYYMLFILKPGDRAGIDYPSVARIIQLKSA